MQWHEQYDAANEPVAQQIEDYVSTPLWDDLAGHLQQAYGVRPSLFYSRCSMDNGFWMGWNVKYKKSGKALCTLYPKQGYYVALIAIGAKESAGAELLMPLCDVYTQQLYRQTKEKAAGCLLPSLSLAAQVTSDSILRDVKDLIALRVAPRKSAG